MGRGLIPRRKQPESCPLWSPETQSRRRHAVLALLSERYSPPKGRLPTCYSPVRRFTHPRKGFLARLACVKRAASVRSEPGSNSPIKSSVSCGIEPTTINLSKTTSLTGRVTKVLIPGGTVNLKRTRRTFFRPPVGSGGVVARARVFYAGSVPRSRSFLKSRAISSCPLASGAHRQSPRFIRWGPQGVKEVFEKNRDRFRDQGLPRRRARASQAQPAATSTNDST
jgi:hypothetical protein